MPVASSILVPDTSCLILLKNIDELSLLKESSSRVCITPIIRNEFGEGIPGWAEVPGPKEAEE
jgi:predicted nucleic acid-binding protein